MKIPILPFLIFGILFVACKKTYTCECSDNNGVYATYKFKNTKKKAKEECDAVPHNDMVNPGAHCDLK